MTNLPDYIIHSGLFKAVPIEDLLLVEYQCLIDEPRSEIWSHTSYLAYVIGGEKKWKTPVDEYKITSHDALFVKKGAHSVFQYFNEPFFVIFIFIPDDFIRRILFKNWELKYYDHASETDNYHNHQLMLLTQNEVMKSFFNSLLAYFSPESVVSQKALLLKMEELILNIMIQPGNHRLKRYFFDIARSRGIDMKEIMSVNCLNPLSLSDYARLCAMSLSTFQREFKSLFGQTPGKWLMARRLEYSKFLLETTNQSTAEIMDGCGFVNRSHFVKSFKNTFGISPSRYRQQYTSLNQ